MNASSIRSIAILRALKLGDMLCATPALRAIRRYWPDAHIALIALPWLRELAGRYAHLIDELIDFPGYPGLPEQAPNHQAVERFIGTMRDRQFDLILQMHGSGEVTNPLIQRLGGRQTAGFYAPRTNRPHAPTFLPWVEQIPESLRYLDLLAHLGVPIQGSRLEFPVEGSDWAQLERLRQELGFESGQFVCVHTGASVPERRWAAASFASVADRAAQRGYTIVLTGGTEERELTAHVAAHMRQPSIDLAGRTSLGLLAALVSRARLVLCNDTGISHIAAATQTPSVVVSPVSDPRRWGPVNRRLHRVVDARRGASAEIVWRSIEALLHDVASGDSAFIGIESSTVASPWSNAQGVNRRPKRMMNLHPDEAR